MGDGDCYPRQPITIDPDLVAERQREMATWGDQALIAAVADERLSHLTDWYDAAAWTTVAALEVEAARRGLGAQIDAQIAAWRALASVPSTPTDADVPF